VCDMPTQELNAFRILEREIRDLVSSRLDASDLTQLVEEYEAALGSKVYSDLLVALCHLRFSPEDAKTHWLAACEHVESVAAALDRRVDFRVALLDYFLSQPDGGDEASKLVEIKILQRRQEFAMRDELTGLYDHKYLSSELDREIRRADRDGTPLALAIFDIDYFKWYNDRNGVLQGDRALRDVAKLMCDNVRDGDLVARYGGEEFAVLLTATTKPEALDACRRISAAVSSAEIPFREHQPGKVFSISGGLAAYRTDGLSANELLESADKALYLAKGRGRNLVLAACDENREFQRAEVQIPGQLQRMSAERETLVIKNISVSGVQFSTNAQLQPGDFFHFYLMLPRTCQKIDAVARVLRADEQDGERVVGARIVDIAFPYANALAEFVELTSESSNAH
ncbi:MAG: diguanylate cyclase, partial [Planctomycetota bacterium]